MTHYPAPDEREREAVVGALAALLRGSPSVEYAFGHGSFFEGLPYHDVDVAIRIPEGVPADYHALYALAAMCGQAIGRPVDLQELNGTSPGFRRAATSGTLLCARDPEAALLYGELLQRLAWDWRPMQEQIIRDLAP